MPRDPVFPAKLDGKLAPLDAARVCVIGPSERSRQEPSFGEFERSIQCVLLDALASIAAVVGE